MKQKQISWVTVFSLFCLCFLLSFSGYTAFAAETEQATTLETTVPVEHTISIQADGNLSYEINGQPYTGSAEIRLPRGSKAVLVFYPAQGQQITSLLVNGEDMAGQLLDGSYTIESLVRQTQLVVTVSGQAEQPGTPSGEPGGSTGTPQTGDSMNPAPFLFGAVLSAGILVSCMVLRKKNRRDSLDSINLK